MARIGKHKGCGGEFHASEISNDRITGVTCDRCRKQFRANIISKQKRQVIAEFERVINRGYTKKRRNTKCRR